MSNKNRTLIHPLADAQSAQIVEASQKSGSFWLYCPELGSVGTATYVRTHSSRTTSSLAIGSPSKTECYYGMEYELMMMSSLDQM